MDFSRYFILQCQHLVVYLARADRIVELFDTGSSFRVFNGKKWLDKTASMRLLKKYVKNDYDTIVLDRWFYKP